jgi:hypothetical protein
MSAILVVLFHVPWISHFKLSPLVANGWAFVDLFFVLSGFVISHSYLEKLNDQASLQKFAIKRFFRLYPLHIFAMATTLSIVVGRNLIRERHICAGIDGSAYDFLASLFLVHALGFSHPFVNTPSWSISAEFMTYLVFAAIAVLTSKPTRWMLAIGSIALAGLLWANGSNGLMTALEYGFPRCLAGFAIGVGLCCLRKRYDYTIVGMPASGLYLLSIAIIYISFERSEAGPIVRSLLQLMSFALLCFVATADRGSHIKNALTTKTLRRLGEISYSIYLMHVTVLMLMSSVVTKFAPFLKLGFLQSVNVPQLHLFLGDSVTILFLGLLIAVSSPIYEYLELPARNFGARLANEVGSRKGFSKPVTDRAAQERTT